MNPGLAFLAVVNLLGILVCVILLFVGIDLIVTGLLAFGFMWGLICLVVANTARMVDRR